MTPLGATAMQHRSIATWSFIFLAVTFCWANLTEAKPARCFTSDDGSFSCEFHATARDGSFEISAPGKPTYILNMIEPGVASGFVNLGTRNIPLPGRYLRSSAEPACWVNDSTGAKICAW
jgi:hypothetical protein